MFIFHVDNFRPCKTQLTSLKVLEFFVWAALQTLFTAVPRLTQPSTLCGAVKVGLAVGTSNNKWRWLVWSVAASRGWFSAQVSQWIMKVWDQRGWLSLVSLVHWVTWRLCFRTAACDIHKLEAHWDSAYLCQGTSYQCRDISPAIWRIGSRSPLNSNYLFAGPLPTFPENLVQIRSEVFAQSC